MEDKKIIELFFGRDEAAIAESGKKYGKYLRYIAFSVLGDEFDCEEVENDTYLRAWNSIPPERPVSHLYGSEYVLLGFDGESIEQIESAALAHVENEDHTRSTVIGDTLFIFAESDCKTVKIAP